MQQQHVDWVIQEKEKSNWILIQIVISELVTLLIFKRETDFCEQGTLSFELTVMTDLLPNYKCIKI